MAPDPHWRRRWHSRHYSSSTPESHGHASQPSRQDRPWNCLCVSGAEAVAVASPPTLHCPPPSGHWWTCDNSSDVSPRCPNRCDPTHDVTCGWPVEEEGTGLSHLGSHSQNHLSVSRVQESRNWPLTWYPGLDVMLMACLRWCWCLCVALSSSDSLGVRDVPKSLLRSFAAATAAADTVADTDIPTGTTLTPTPPPHPLPLAGVLAVVVLTGTCDTSL